MEKSVFFRKAALFFLAFLVVSTGFQISSGAWRSDFGGHADEAAHVVTSLMVRDYLAGGFLKTPHPMRFAESYYQRFPKVALGHYPPAFYLGAAIPLLPFRDGAALLGFMNLVGAATSLVLWILGRRLLGGDAPGAAVAILYLLLPQTRTYTAIVMSDLLLVFFCLLAAVSFTRFLEKKRSSDSLWFGLWAAAAILTKGSGIGLAVLPPLALVLCGNWSLFGNPRLWLAPLPVLVFALPWILFTMGITAEGMQEKRGLDWMIGALPFYGRAGVGELGWIAMIALAASLIFLPLRRLGRPGSIGPLEAVLWALLVSGLAVPLFVPAGLDERYLMPVVPPALLLGIAMAKRLVGGLREIVGLVAVVATVVLILVEVWRPVQKSFTGAGEVVEAVLQEAAPSEGAREIAHVLVISSAGGEGALVAAAALGGREELAVARGTKILASSDWVGRGYRTTFGTPEEFLRILSENEIRYLVIDPADPSSPFEHWRMAETMIPGLERIRLLKTFPSRRKGRLSEFRVFRFEDLPGSSSPGI